MGIDVVRKDGKFQLWEATFSREATPLTPCGTREELAHWLTRDVRGHARVAAYAANLAAVERGWMPSLPGAIDPMKEANP